MRPRFRALGTEQREGLFIQMVNTEKEARLSLE